MSDRVIIDPAEQDLMRDLAHFAARKATNGVYMGTFYSTSLGAKVMVVVALGEQSDALTRVIMGAAVPDEATILNTPGGKGFLDDGSNGTRH